MRTNCWKICLGFVIASLLLMPAVGCRKKGEEISTISPSPGLTIVVKKERTLPVLPADLVARSDMYSFDIKEGKGEPVKITIPLKVEVAATRNLDAYTWKEGEWEWFTSAFLGSDGRSAEVDCPIFPSNLAIVQAGAKPPQISGWLNQGETLDQPAPNVLTVLNPIDHQAKPDGTVGGQATQTPYSQFETFPTIQNKVGQEFRGDIIDDILSSNELREKHVAAIADLAQTNGYPGIDIDYRDIDAKLRSQFTQFVSDLAARLHSNGRLLTIRVGPPHKVGQGWDFGAHDLRELGKVADTVKIPGEEDQDLYAASIVGLLDHATRLIDRRKIQLVVDRSSHERGEMGITRLSQREALEIAAEVDIDGPSKVELGQATTLLASHLAGAGKGSGLFWNGETKNVTLVYEAADGQHVVWIENIFSLAFKLESVSQFNLGGIAIEGVGDEPGGAQIWSVVQSFRDGSGVAPTRPNEGLFVPQWEGSGGGLEVGPSNQVTWTAPQTPGDYQVTLTVSDGDARLQSSLTLSAVTASSIKPTPTPRPPATSTPTATPSASPKATATPTSVVAPTATPRPTSTPTTAPPPGGNPYSGVGYGMCVNPYNDLNRALIVLKQAGFNWAKVQLRWEYLQPAPGDENIQWGSIDSIVNTCQAQGVRVLFSIVTAPAWARPGDTDFSVPGPPANLQDFADFVGKVANRYKGRIHAIEVWNEQNLWYEWGGRGHKINAVQYVDLLRRSYQSIKAADPNVVVVSGALTPTGLSDYDTAVDDVVYMREMYQAGLKNWCDVVGAHANVAGHNAPDEWISTTDTNTRKWHGSFFFLRFRELYQVMQSYGDGGKQIWFTEFGWASLENIAASPVPGYEYAAEVSEQEHAAYLPRAFELVKQSDPYVGVMFVWNLNYNGAPEDEKSAWSVLYRDWNPRPAYHSLAAMPK